MIAHIVPSTLTALISSLPTSLRTQMLDESFRNGYEAYEISGKTVVVQIKKFGDTDLLQHSQVIPLPDFLLNYPGKLFAGIETFEFVLNAQMAIASVVTSLDGERLRPFSWRSEGRDYRLPGDAAFSVKSPGFCRVSVDNSGFVILRSIYVRISNMYEITLAAEDLWGGNMTELPSRLYQFAEAIKAAHSKSLSALNREVPQVGFAKI